MTQQRAGSVLLLRDRDGDGVADERREVVGGIDWVHGITIDGNTMYLASTPQVLVAELRPDGGVGEPRVIIDDLAPGGRHENRTLAVGPDRKLYIDVGSTCNACIEENARNGTMLRANLDGSDLRIIMRGLRNTTGFGWHPVTHALWGMDHGTDWLGDTIPPEELNRLVEGADYGWPFCWGKQQVAAIGLRPPHATPEDYCRKTRPMVPGYDAHASPIGMIFYAGMPFPAEFRNDAFITMRGSWNRRDPRGYEVVRVHFDAAGNPVRFEPFVTGFLVDDGTAQFGRLAGIAIARDGALLFTDDENGVLYRVAYRGDAPSSR